MEKDKSNCTKGSWHYDSRIGSPTNVDVVRLSDEASEGCPAPSGYPEGKKMYRANSDFVLREIAGEALLVPTGISAKRLNGMITFTGSGAFLWKQLMESPKTIKHLSVTLANEYGITIETAEKDVTEFIEKAIENDMVLCT